MDIFLSFAFLFLVVYRHSPGQLGVTKANKGLLWNFDVMTDSLCLDDLPYKWPERSQIIA